MKFSYLLAIVFIFFSVALKAIEDMGKAWQCDVGIEVGELGAKMESETKILYIKFDDSFKKVHIKFEGEEDELVFTVIPPKGDSLHGVSAILTQEQGGISTLTFSVVEENGIPTPKVIINSISLFSTYIYNIKGQGECYP